jgi:cyclic pyranopterin phosphate synthase
MVDVAAKKKTERVAIASARIRMSGVALEAIRRQRVEKGDVISAARLAGIMAAKKTSDLIPLCHPIGLSGVEVEVLPKVVGVEIRATVKTVERTGVEMEALAAVSAAALTVYDMLKSTDRAMVIEAIQLEFKSGGRSGVFTRSAQGDTALKKRRRPK